MDLLNVIGRNMKKFKFVYRRSPHSRWKCQQSARDKFEFWKLANIDAESEEKQQRMRNLNFIGIDI